MNLDVSLGLLVPTVYLARVNAVDLTHSGALVAGNVVNLNASGDVNNGGHVKSDLATTIIGNNIVNGGIIGSGGTTAVVAVQDVRNVSGRIGGGDVVVKAGRDVINETRINAANGATIASGGDTNIIGANVNARQVNADIGGNLNIASVQDTQTSMAHQQGSGGGFSISQAGGGANYSDQHGNANGGYAGVGGQSGIHAGAGGFSINVQGNTDLKGAVIASDADASKNTLNTGTLTFSDITNASSYNASSSGFSAGGSIGAPASGTGTTSVGNAGGLVPMLSQSDSGSESATTRSAISAGTINVKDQDHQTQDVASLSRDTSNTNGTVSKLPDINHVLDKQGDMMNAASAAGEAASTQIGAIADAKRDGAIKDAKAAYERGDLDAMQSYVNTADLRSEGGSARTALHTAGGGLIGGLGGGGIGSAAQGAAGAGMSAALANQTAQLADAIAGATGSQFAGNIAGNAVNALGGGIIGGTAGAASASNVNLYNQFNDKK